MESLNKWLRVEARKSYEEKLKKIPDLIKYHDICKRGKEIFLSRGYMRKARVERSSYYPSLILHVEPDANLSKVVAFFMEEFEETCGLQDLYVSQEVSSSGLVVYYKSRRFAPSKLSIVFKLPNTGTCMIVEKRTERKFESVERTIVC